MSAPDLANLDANLLRDLARDYGTPLYVTNMDIVFERIEHLRAFDRIRYAQKAYSNLSFLRRIREAGCHLDVVSAGEIDRALAAGFAADQMVYTADLLDDDGAKLVAAHGIHVCAGSRFMLDRVAEIFRGKAAEITLRINPGFGDGHDFKVITGGTRSKHGIWHEDLEATLQQARSLGLKVTGLHAHIGSGAGHGGFSKLREALPKLARTLGHELKTLSVGGGLPVPYRDDAPVFDARAHADAWRIAADQLQDDLGHSFTLEVEPGRYLVAPAAVLLAKVHGVKMQGDERYAMVDAGFHTLARPLLYGSHHRMHILGKEREALVSTHIAGPLCETGDELSRGPDRAPAAIPLAPCSAGDLLVIRDVGAYGASMASNYNSQPLPAEVLVHKGQPLLARARQSSEHLLALERPPHVPQPE